MFYRTVTVLFLTIIVSSCFKEPTEVKSRDNTENTELADFAKCFLNSLVAKDKETAKTNCLVSESEFRRLIKDSVSYYYEVVKDYGETMFVLYDTLWNRDTVTAKDTSDKKYRINGKTWIADSMRYSYKTAMTVSHFDFHKDIENRFDSLFTALYDSVSWSDSDYVSVKSSDGDSTGHSFYPFLDFPEIKTDVWGMKNANIIYKNNNGELASFNVADFICLTEDGWKIVFPSNMVYYNRKEYSDSTTLKTESFNIIGLWKAEFDSRDGSHLNMRMQFNSNDSFAYIDDNLSPDKIIKGRYGYENYTIIYKDSLVIGDFMIRDPNNPNEFDIKRNDTLRQSDSIVYFDMLGSGDPADSIALATWPIVQYSRTLATIGQLTFYYQFTLYWTKENKTDSVGFMTRKKSRYGHYDSLYFIEPSFPEAKEAFGFSRQIPPGYFGRLTTTSDNEWKNIQLH